jgi:hypothetical protein
LLFLLFYAGSLCLLKNSPKMALNSVGTSIIGAWPHLSIQWSSELRSSFLNSSATRGGVMVSFKPHIKQVGDLMSLSS